MLERRRRPITEERVRRAFNFAQEKLTPESGMMWRQVHLTLLSRLMVPYLEWDVPSKGDPMIKYFVEESLKVQEPRYILTGKL